MNEPSRLAELRAERHRLLHSFEYAYAMGHRQTLGPRDPRLDWVLYRLDALRREIAELERAEPGRDGPGPAPGS